MNFIEGLFEAHLEVKNLENCMEFYEKKLGFKLGRYENDRRRAFYLIDNNPITMISIVEKKEPNYRHIAFRVDYSNLHKMIPSLEEQGSEILPGWTGADPKEPIVFPWLGAACVFFNDPDGNRLEFLSLLPVGPREDIKQVFVSLSEWSQMKF